MKAETSDAVCFEKGCDEPPIGYVFVESPDSTDDDPQLIAAAPACHAHHRSVGSMLEALTDMASRPGALSERVAVWLYQSVQLALLDMGMEHYTEKRKVNR